MTSSNTSILNEIAALEDARYTAMLKGDVATLERLLHPVLVYMHSSGVADSKASYISGLRDGVWNYQHIERTDQKTFPSSSQQSLSLSLISRPPKH